MMAASRSVLIRAIYALCLAGAAYNHARILLEHGLRYDYGGVPLFYRLFWTGLTFFDPLAILLLLLVPRAGLGLTLAIIAVDVAVNATATFIIGPDYLSLGAQTLFLAFVLATIGYAWPGKMQRSMA